MNLRYEASSGGTLSQNMSKKEAEYHAWKHGSARRKKQKKEKKDD